MNMLRIFHFHKYVRLIHSSRKNNNITFWSLDKICKQEGLKRLNEGGQVSYSTHDSGFIMHAPCSKQRDIKDPPPPTASSI